MKIRCILFILCGGLLLSACSNSNISFNSEEILLENIVDAISKEDSAALRALFSNSTKASAVSLDSDTEQFIQMFKGDIITYCCAGGSNTERRVEGGKIRVDVRYSYIIETENHKYYIATQYCTIDTFDSNNIGLNSINITTDKYYLSKSVYRGDGEWSPGITFDMGQGDGSVVS